MCLSSSWAPGWRRQRLRGERLSLRLLLLAAWPPDHAPAWSGCAHRAPPQSDALCSNAQAHAALLVLPPRRQGLDKAKKEEYDAVIVDTAGRLQIDERLMEELREVGGWAGLVVQVVVGLCGWLCACCGLVVACSSLLFAVKMPCYQCLWHCSAPMAAERARMLAVPHNHPGCSTQCVCAALLCRPSGWSAPPTRCWSWMQ